MSADRIAAAHNRRRRTLVRATTATARRLWASLDPVRLDDWRRLLLQLLVALDGAQLAVAASADDYLDEVLAAQHLDPTPTGRIAPRSLAGVASDGRDLASLLQQPLIATKMAIGAGVPVPRALATGQAGLEMIVATQVADAGRVADQVALTARPAATGYVRMLVGASCARCVVLAGRTYRWNQGFRRHPQCNCVHIPSRESISSDLAVDPAAHFRALTRAEQDRIFTKAGAEAIRDGADLGSVVNARRGMYTASAGSRSIQATREATTTRGLFGGYQIDPATGQLRRRADIDLTKQGRYRQARTVRLMPEQIYAEARGDRNEAIRLLRRFGYLT